MPKSKPGRTYGTPIKADLIREELKRRHWTVQRLADEINYSRQAVQGSLSLGRMSAEMITLVAYALEMSWEDFVDEPGR